MGLTKWEKETIINYNQESGEAEVYTRDENVMRRLENLCRDYPDYYKKTKETSTDKEYRCPKNLIAFRKPVIMTDEQREKLRERAKLLFKPQGEG